jgi:hypothetical protein
MSNQEFEDMYIVEGQLLLGGLRYKRIAPSVILVLPSLGNEEFSETDLQCIKQTFEIGNKNQKLRRYDSKQVIVIYREIE